MPDACKRACDFPRCPNMVPANRWLCDDHRHVASKEYDHQRSDSASRKLLNSAAWHKLRDTLLTRNPQCQVIEDGRQCSHEPSVGHHITDHCGSPRLFFAWGNLVAICAGHHASSPAVMARAHFIPTNGILGQVYDHGYAVPEIMAAPPREAPAFYTSSNSDHSESEKPALAPRIAPAPAAPRNLAGTWAAPRPNPETRLNKT
jgi:hypothetical protein